MKYGSHSVLISCARIFQPKGHHCAVEISDGCSKGSLFRIFRCHLNLIIPIESFYKGESGIPHSSIYQ